MNREILRQAMSEENVNALRRLYAERARGNFAAGAELLSADAIVSWEVPEGRTVSRGREAADHNFRAFLKQWEDFRTAADEFVELDERTILVIGQIRGLGKHSGAQTEAPTFEVWVFDGGTVVAQHQSFTREAALAAAGLSE